MIFDEGGVSGAAAKGFDADGSGAGEDVEEAGAGNAATEHVEEGFAQAVAGGAEGEAFEAFEDAAAIGSGDDAHGFASSADPREMVAALPMFGESGDDGAQFLCAVFIVCEGEGFSAG